MEEFVSEAVTALAGQFDTQSMATGVPGLPNGFTWRDDEYAIAERLDQWKQTSAEGGRAGGEVYLRRHYYRLRMNDGAIWTVYFVRRTSGGRTPSTRWFLFSIEWPEPPPGQ